MISVENIFFSVPEDSPTVVAKRLEEALQRVEGRTDGVLRMIFTVNSTGHLFKDGSLWEMRDAVEPFRTRVKYACVENVVVVPNVFARAATRAALVFFRPDVTTRIVKKYKRDVVKN